MSRKRKTNRRQFLQGKSALAALTDFPDDDAGGTESPSGDAAGSPRSPSAQSQADRPFLHEIGRTAMACRFQVYLTAGQHDTFFEAALGALDLVERLEDQMSIFRNHSQISLINRRAASEPIRVEPRLLALLELAAGLSESTGGAFDITAGPLSQVWGFRRRSGRLPEQREIDEALQCVGAQWLELDPVASTVRFRKHGVEIDLGGIGKGYALDRCAEHLARAGVCDYVIHGGHSSVLARGSRLGRAADDPGWTVAVRRPLRADQRLAEIRLRNRALGTSGSGNQFFYHQGRRYGHVLDPRTGWPAEGVLSCTVLAPTAAAADALSTAFFVMGVDAVREYCRGRDELAALMVCLGARSGSIEVHPIGLNDDDWRRLDCTCSD